MDAAELEEQKITAMLKRKAGEYPTDTYTLPELHSLAQDEYLSGVSCHTNLFWSRQNDTH